MYQETGLGLVVCIFSNKVQVHKKKKWMSSTNCHSPQDNAYHYNASSPWTTTDHVVVYIILWGSQATNIVISVT